MDRSAEGGSSLLFTCRTSTHRTGDVGGVNHSSSLERTSTGPMASGILQSHFQTAAVTRLTSGRAMLRGAKGCGRLLGHRVALTLCRQCRCLNPNSYTLTGGQPKPLCRYPMRLIQIVRTVQAHRAPMWHRGRGRMYHLGHEVRYDLMQMFKYYNPHMR